MRKKKKTQRKPINNGKFMGIWFEITTKDKIIKVCNEKNITASAFIRDAVIEKLEREGF